MTVEIIGPEFSAMGYISGGIKQPISDTETLVIADIKRRQELGVKKYGTTLAYNPLTLEQWLNHQYEELLDGALYCKRAIQEVQMTNVTKGESK